MARKVQLKVEFDNQPISHISHLSLSQPLNEHHHFELRTQVREKENMLSVQLNSFIGKKVKMEISYGDEQKKGKNYWEGIVTNIGLSKHQGINDEIIFQGFGPTKIMDDGPHCQSFLDKPLKDIVATIGSKYSLSLENNPGHADKNAYSVQYQESSFHYLARLANRFGEWFLYDGSKIYFGAPPKDKAIPLVFGRDLLSLDLELNLAPSKYRLLSYDYVAHKFPESPSSSVSVNGLEDYSKMLSDASEALYKNEPSTIISYDLNTKSEIDALSQYQKSAKASDYVTFHGASYNHLLKLGSIVKIEGLILDEEGKKKDLSYGEYRIVHLSHSVDGAGDYINHFQAIPSKLIVPPENKNIKSLFCEIQTAEILDNNDPEKLGRVVVQFWWQKATNDKTPWIRIAASGAGSGHGAFFIPEKGDQVLIGFEFNNPQAPYVIGSLYHGKSKPQGVADPNNNKKVIKTKSGNQIFLSDEGGSEEIKIENGTNVIVLSLGGSGKISISTDGDLELNATNISLSAKENVTINAKKTESNAETDIVQTAQGNLELKGTTAVKIAGTEVEINAQTTAKLDGIASTDITGAIVNINGKTMVTVEGAIVKLN